jgi:hypothetical protein
MKKLLSLLLALVFAASPVPAARAAEKTPLAAALERAAAYTLAAVENPSPGAVGGDWAIVGLARSGVNLPEGYVSGYYKAVERYARERGGVLSARRYTDYARVVLGVTAAGYDARTGAGYDLTAPLGDCERVLAQGINGAAFALIALDSRNYPAPADSASKTGAARQIYVDEILKRQLPGGGWALTSGADKTGDPDVTAMALQALARYKDQKAVKDAAEKALAFLAASRYVYAESAAQTLTALCEWGVPLTDKRFTKNAGSMLDVLLSFQNADGGFRHTSASAASSPMTAEQALYALAAAKRAAGGQPSLYRMAGLEGAHADVNALALKMPERGGAAPITRAEFAAALTAALGLPARGSGAFKDAPGSASYSGAVNAAYYYELMDGTGDRQFSPDARLTRKEAVGAVARAAKLCGAEGYKTGAEYLTRQTDAAARGDVSDMIIKLISAAGLI